MNETKIYLLLYFTNLAFIVTNVYGWILKEFYTAKPYREHFEALFPAQRFVGFLYLAQLMEIPYLLMMGRDILFTVVNVWFMLYTIKPHRKMVQEEVAPVVISQSIPAYKLSAERCLELERQIMTKMESEKIYRNPALTIEIYPELTLPRINHILPPLHHLFATALYSSVLQRWW